MKPRACKPGHDQINDEEERRKKIDHPSASLRALQYGGLQRIRLRHESGFESGETYQQQDGRDDGRHSEAFRPLVSALGRALRC